MTTTTTRFMPLSEGIALADLQAIVYILAAIGGLLAIGLLAMAWGRWKYRREQSRLMDEFVAQQSSYIGALKSEADHYRLKTDKLVKEMCDLKSHVAHELGMLRGQLASMQRIVTDHCRHYQPTDAEDPGCVYCSHPETWGRVQPEETA